VFRANLEAAYDYAELSRMAGKRPGGNTGAAASAHTADEAPLKGPVSASDLRQGDQGESDETNLTGRHVSAAAVLVMASMVMAACSSTPVTQSSAD
jgi:hypothetical protein